MSWPRNQANSTNRASIELGGLVVRPACTDYSHQKFIGKNGIFLTRLLNLTATEEKCAI
jgi:hypothetical protein